MPTITIAPAEVLAQLAALKKIKRLQDFVLTPAQQARYNELLQLRRARVKQLLAR